MHGVCEKPLGEVNCRRVWSISLLSSSEKGGRGGASICLFLPCVPRAWNGGASTPYIQHHWSDRCDLFHRFVLDSDVKNAFQRKARDFGNFDYTVKVVEVKLKHV